MQTKTTGIILIILGIIAMIYTGFNYVTTKKVVDIGSVQVDSKEHHHVQWSPIVGTVLIVGGVVILATNRKSNA